MFLELSTFSFWFLWALKRIFQNINLLPQELEKDVFFACIVPQTLLGITPGLSVFVGVENSGSMVCWWFRVVLFRFQAEPEFVIAVQPEAPTSGLNHMKVSRCGEQQHYLWPSDPSNHDSTVGGKVNLIYSKLGVGIKQRRRCCFSIPHFPSYYPLLLKWWGYVGLTMESQDTAIEPAISAEAGPLGTISHDAAEANFRSAGKHRRLVSGAS